MKYANYDQKTIYLVSKTKNPKLFPRLKIPRSTAIYWIRNKKHLNLKIHENESSSESVALRTQLEDLRCEIRELKNELKTIRTYLSIMSRNKLIRTPESATRYQIVQAIRNNRGRNSIRKILNSLEVSFSTYKRWAKEDPVIQNSKEYTQTTSRSLTEAEVRNLRHLYLDKSLFFYPLHALSTKAKRDQLLFVSPRTWQKYVKKLKLQRPVLLKKSKKEYPIGVRANSPHDIWHIDVTEFRINKKRIYMQTIIDNYSRSVLAFQVCKAISGLNTVKIITFSIKKFGLPVRLMSDAGKENLNSEVRCYLTKLNVKHKVSKVNTRFSNSMIEVFFRTLKTNYLNHVKIKSEKDLILKINFYVQNYNFEIPHSALNFRTPYEVLREIPPDYYPVLFKEFHKKALKERMNEYSKK